MSGNNDLRQKIDEAKRRLSLPQLMQQLGLGEHAKKQALCLWHDDQNPSFSVFKGKDGFWHYKCFVCDVQGGDEITFLVKHLGIVRHEAIKRYLEMAGFPTCAPKSHEYPKCPEPPGSLEYPKSLGSPEYPVFPVHPVSNGQGAEKDLLSEKDLKGLAARNACTAHNTAKKRRWQLLRDLKAVELRHGALDTTELMLTFDEWHRLSQLFLDSKKTRDDYLALFLAEFGKVRVPTGEGETLKKAVENVSKLSPDQLPEIPGLPNAPESWRRLLSLHRELACLIANGIYFLSYRNAAAICGMTHQEAHTITGVLVTLGAIDIVDKGKAGLNSRRAAEFRCLLPRNGNSAEADLGVEI